MWTRILGVGLASLLLGCNPYTLPDDAGAVDPANFPPAYVGTGGDRLRAGRGVFNEAAAYVNFARRGYFSFPFATTQFGKDVTNPRLIADKDGKPLSKVIPLPVAYQFDPVTPCHAPAGYVYDPRTDDVHLDQQGAVLTSLPTATYNPGQTPTWSYVPIVSALTISGGGADCQTLTSEEVLKQRGLVPSMVSTKLLAWAVIDVAAGVYRVGQTPANSDGYSTQQLGWYNRLVAAYIDGGEVPTEAAPPDMMGNPTGTQLKVQRLYIPKTVILPDPKNMNMPGPLAGAAGGGYDVLEAARGDAGYSPVCQVYTYDTGTPVTPDQLPTAVSVIQSYYGATIKPAAPAQFLFCLQVQP